MPLSHISHYRLLEELGTGGMGRVYKAHDSILQRTVAIKVLHASRVNDPERKLRFMQEARAASALNHPGIVTIYEIGESADVDFIAMEYVEGRTLEALMRDGQLGLDQALDYATQMADALGKAHAAGIVHRDLKPGNVMVTPDGRIKILDFGLAKLTAWSASTEPLTEATMSLAMPGPTPTSEGTIIGTAAYMAPEQADGKVIDQRADVFSLGVVLYEMLSGANPFRKSSTARTLAAILQDEPARIGSIPAGISQVLSRALKKDPEERYASAAEMASGLHAAKRTTEKHRHIGRPMVAAAVLLIVACAAAGAWMWHRQNRIRWAKGEGLAEVSRLLSEDKGQAAFDLAQEIGRIVPRDPGFLLIWPEVAHTPLINTNPPGADVYLQDIEGAKSWRYVGKTPISNVPIPHGFFKWKAVKQGYAEAAGAQSTWASQANFVLSPEGKVPARMVLVPGANSLGATVITVGDRAPREPFFLDQFETTNREYKEFIDKGGYQEQEFWKHPFRKDERLLSWEKAMLTFRDSSGLPGPSTWEGGTFPAGQEDFPVSGVSWYEAAAFAEFAGKSLPTVYHWLRAADVRLTPYVIRVSNFASKGTAPVGTYAGIGPFGTFDMAGNVAEWCFNEAQDGYRFILGSAWNRPTYSFNQPDARPPFDRSAGNGFRCVRYIGAPADWSTKPIVSETRDYSAEKPASDDVFRVLARSYEYDPRPLNAKVEDVDDSSPYWRKEKVTFDAAYGSEPVRVPVFVHIPKNARPPYEAVLFHPGAGAQNGNLASLDSFNRVDFIVRSGRVVIYPIYIGTFNRRLPAPETALQRKERQVKRFQDLKRTVEYCLTRSDIDRTKLAYVGGSWGAANAPIMVSLQQVFKAAVLYEGGLFGRPQLPEIDNFHFLPRLKVPVLMLNGKYDYTFPLETSQRPFFKWLGTPEKDKRHIVYDSAHDVMLYRPTVIREVLTWLDRYLGPVQPES